MSLTSLVGSLWPPFGAFVSGGPVTDGADFLSALNAILRADGDVSAIASNRVYLDESPRTPTYPMVVVSMIDSEVQVTNNKLTFAEFVDVQVTVMGQGSASTVETLGKAAFSALCDKPSNPTITFDDGYVAGRWPIRRRGPYRMPNLGAGNAYVYAYLFEYRFLIGREY